MSDTHDSYDSYVLHVYTEETPERAWYNHYGYWDGTDYRRRGNVYPRLERDISDRTRHYKSLQTASNAIPVVQRYDRVIQVSIVAVDGDTLTRVDPLPPRKRRAYGSGV